MNATGGTATPNVPAGKGTTTAAQEPNTSFSQFANSSGKAKPTVLLFQMGQNGFVGNIFTKIFNSHGVELETVKVVEGEVPSRASVDDYDGVVLSGSAFMVTDKHPWSVRTGELIRPVVERGITPVLGVCYGHQLILHTLGAPVSFLKSRQIGSKRCTLTSHAKNDPLFSVFEGRESIAVHVLHRQSVTKLPDNVVVLASNDVDPYHACKIGERCWTTQFHPELKTVNVKAVVDFQKDNLINDGLDYQSVKSSILETVDGALILERFAEICKERYKETLPKL